MDKDLYDFINLHYNLFDIRIVKQMGRFYNLSISNRNALKYDLTRIFKKPKGVAIYNLLELEDFYKQLARDNQNVSFLDSIRRYYSLSHKALYRKGGMM